MLMRNRKFLAINLIISEEQYIYVYRPVGIYPLPSFVILRLTCPAKLPLYILAYFQDHQPFRLGIISLPQPQLIADRCIKELIFRLKSPWLRLQKRRNCRIWRSELHIKQRYRILDILRPITLI